ARCAHSALPPSEYQLPVASPCFFSMIPPPPRSTLFPYTTLFRSVLVRGRPSTYAYNPVGPLNFETFEGNPTVVQGQRIGLEIPPDRKSTRLNSSHVAISYAVFCLKKKNINHNPIAANTSTI